jgi:hypothetical protein
MSVAELKAQADALSPAELDDLARHVRALALRKDPRRQGALNQAALSSSWLTQEEFEKHLADLDRGGR